MKTYRIWIVLLVLVLAALACVVPSTTPVAPALPPPTPVTLEQPSPINIDIPEQENTLVGLYEHVMPGIVSLQVVGDTGGSLGSALRSKRFGTFGMPSPARTAMLKRNA